MNFALRKNARITPAIRAEIAASAGVCAHELSRPYSVTQQTIYK